MKVISFIPYVRFLPRASVFLKQKLRTDSSAESTAPLDVVLRENTSRSGWWPSFGKAATPYSDKASESGSVPALADRTQSDFSTSPTPYVRQAHSVDDSDELMYFQDSGERSVQLPGQDLPSLQTFAGVGGVGQEVDTLDNNFPVKLQKGSELRYDTFRAADDDHESQISAPCHLRSQEETHVPWRKLSHCHTKGLRYGSIPDLRVKCQFCCADAIRARLVAVAVSAAMAVSMDEEAIEFVTDIGVKQLIKVAIAIFFSVSLFSCLTLQRHCSSFPRSE
jgi:hypothetical protein